MTHDAIDRAPARCSFTRTFIVTGGSEPAPAASSVSSSSRCAGAVLTTDTSFSPYRSMTTSAGTRSAPSHGTDKMNR